MDIIFGQYNKSIRKLTEDKPGEFTFSGFTDVLEINVEETDIEDEYKSIGVTGGPNLIVGMQVTDKLKIKSITFKDGRYKILTENITNERINNEKPQDTIFSDRTEDGNTNVSNEQ